MSHILGRFVDFDMCFQKYGKSQKVAELKINSIIEELQPG